jgi:hypothetical protein
MVDLLSFFGIVPMPGYEYLHYILGGCLAVFGLVGIFEVVKAIFIQLLKSVR